MKVAKAEEYNSPFAPVYPAAAAAAPKTMGIEADTPGIIEIVFRKSITEFPRTSACLIRNESVDLMFGEIFKTESSKRTSFMKTGPLATIFAAPPNTLLILFSHKL